MVRAILDGRKTQTRRKMKPKPASGAPEGAYCNPYNGNFEHFTFWTKDNKLCAGLTGNVKDRGQKTCSWKCPYGVPGDRLWVRETWNMADSAEELMSGEICGPSAPFKGVQGTRSIDWVAVYKATSGHKTHPVFGKALWRPSIHMPRWASRITLEIVNLRAERLNDISEEDAKAEGVVCPYPPEVYCEKGYPEHFKELWTAINRPGSWEKNPWAWVVEFKRIA